MPSNNNAYNYTFKLMIEGIECPFMSANIMCTPNGVESVINVHTNKKLLDLKPKTAVQIFFKEWAVRNPKWCLLFDGFFSRFDKSDSATGGRNIAILCRDFRMDIRKAPAAIAYAGELGATRTEFHTVGLYQKTTIKGTNKSVSTRTFSKTLNTLSGMVARIAGTAAGAGAKKLDDGEYSYTKSFGHKWYPSTTKNKTDKADGSFFLDAFARGVWVEAVGGTTAASFMNRRCRVDKRFMIPGNEAGYALWKSQNLGKLGGESAMGGSKFTSVEAFIMRTAAMFMVRPYSCNSPSLIDLRDSSPAADHVMAPAVRDFLVNRESAEFGLPYMLNESMLLPPMEFTAPPTCNIVFPPMYDRITWQHDIDVDVTRGYFKIQDSLDTPRSSKLSSGSVQVPTALFRNKQENKLPLTLEERYASVNVMQGNVEYNIAATDSSRVTHIYNLDKKKAQAIEKERRELRSKLGLSKSKNLDKVAESYAKKRGVDKSEIDDLLRRRANIKERRENSKAGTDEQTAYVTDSLRRHAIFKYIETRFAGRVATIDMAFNPYLICGFPGAVIADDNSNSYETLNTLIGQVQQVKHFITREGEAMSTMVLNATRFDKEPTDMDENGSPLFLLPTDLESAEIDRDTLKYINEDYLVPEAKAKVKANIKSAYYDLDDEDVNTDYIYAKDVLTTTAAGLAKNKTNTVFIDEKYAPNKVTTFYRDVFGQRNHIMVNKFIDKDGHTKFFMYDSIHEALDALKGNRDLMGNYEACINYIRRNICSEEGFFCGILGLSVKQTRLDKDDNPIIEYVIKSDFDEFATHEEYYGIPTVGWDKLPDELKEENGGTLKADSNGNSAGSFSSIREHSPLTAFIQERKDAARSYISEVKKQAQAVRIIDG